MLWGIPARTEITTRQGLLGQNASVWRHPIYKILLFAYIAWGGWNWFINRPVHPADGILAAAEPQQVDTSGTAIRMGRWTLMPRATYRITARILGVERYHFDSLANLIPEDFALGWGPMSDNTILKAMDISQSNRFYFWRLSNAALLPREVIISHSANTHLIPENSRIARQLSRLRRGQVVTLSGILVDGMRDDGTWIHTSLVRTDTGAGACEVMLVDDVSLAP
jgi:hypothetical protein